MDEVQRWGAFKAVLVALALSAVNCLVALDTVSYISRGDDYQFGAFGLLARYCVFVGLGVLAAIYLLLCLLKHKRARDRDRLQETNYAERAVKTLKWKRWASVQVLAGLALLAQGLTLESARDRPEQHWSRGSGNWIPDGWALVGEGFGMFNYQVLTVILLVAAEVLHVIAARAAKGEHGALVPGTR